MMLSVVLLAVLAWPAQAPPGPPALDALLDAIAAHAQAYRATIPALTADETVISSGEGFGPFRERDLAKAVFRVTHTAPEAPLEESRQITEFNGKPVSASDRTHFPLLLTGAFAEATTLYFAPGVRPCMEFTLAPGPQPGGAQRIDFKSRQGAPADPACAHIGHILAGYVLIDPATRQVEHLERTVDAAESDASNVGTFIAIDYAPLAVGAETMWLPVRIAAVHHHGKLHFQATYANYHRFTGSMKLLPSVIPVPEPVSPHP